MLKAHPNGRLLKKSPETNDSGAYIDLFQDLA